MFRKILKKKEFLLIASGVVLLILSYPLAFKNTLEAYLLNRNLKFALNAESNLSYHPQYLQRKKYNLDQILKKYKLDSLVFREQAIARIAYIAESENVRLTEIPLKEPYLRTEKFSIQQLDFSGDYYSLIKFLQKVGQEKELGVVRSLNLKTTIQGAQEKKLVLQIYLQIIE